jgi:hypothetical protein
MLQPVLGDVARVRKMVVRTAIKSRAAGLSVEASMKAANEAAARYIREQEEERARVTAAEVSAAAHAASPVAPEQPAPQPPTPSLRRL